jgi:hypothetical protein
VEVTSSTITHSQCMGWQQQVRAIHACMQTLTVSLLLLRMWCLACNTATLSVLIASMLLQQLLQLLTFTLVLRVFTKCAMQTLDHCASVTAAMVLYMPSGLSLLLHVYTVLCCITQCAGPAITEEIGHENKWRLMCMHHYTLRRNLSNVIMVETKKVQKQDVIYTVL